MFSSYFCFLLCLQLVFQVQANSLLPNHRLARSRRHIHLGSNEVRGVHQQSARQAGALDISANITISNPIDTNTTTSDPNTQPPDTQPPPDSQPPPPDTNPSPPDSSPSPPPDSSPSPPPSVSSVPSQAPSVTPTPSDSAPSSPSITPSPSSSDSGTSSSSDSATPSSSDSGAPSSSDSGSTPSSSDNGVSSSTPSPSDSGALSSSDGSVPSSNLPSSTPSPTPSDSITQPPSGPTDSSSPSPSDSGLPSLSIPNPFPSDSSIIISFPSDSGTPTPTPSDTPSDTPTPTPTPSDSFSLSLPPIGSSDSQPPVGPTDSSSPTPSDSSAPSPSDSGSPSPTDSLSLPPIGPTDQPTSSAADQPTSSGAPPDQPTSSAPPDQPTDSLSLPPVGSTSTPDQPTSSGAAPDQPTSSGAAPDQPTSSAAPPVGPTSSDSGIDITSSLSVGDAPTGSVDVSSLFPSVTTALPTGSTGLATVDPATPPPIPSEFSFLTASSLVLGSAPSVSLDPSMTDPDTIPTSAIVTQSGAPVAQPSLPADLPRQILFPTPPTNLDGFTFITIAFRLTLNWKFVALNEQSSGQLFLYTPQIIQAALNNLDASSIKPYALAPYAAKDYDGDPQTLYTTFEAYIPTPLVDQLASEITVLTSDFYTKPVAPVAKQLAQNVVPNFPILYNADPNSHSGDGSGSSPSNSATALNAASNQRRNAIIGVVSAVGGIGLIVLAWWLVKSYMRRKEGAHRPLSDNDPLGYRGAGGYGATEQGMRERPPSVGPDGVRRNSFYFAEDSLRGYTDPNRQDDLEPAAGTSAGGRRPIGGQPISGPVLRQNTLGY